VANARLMLARHSMIAIRIRFIELPSGLIEKKTPPHPRRGLFILNQYSK